MAETSNVYELPVPSNPGAPTNRVAELEAELRALRSVLAQRPAPVEREEPDAAQLRSDLSRASKSLRDARLDEEETARVNELLQRENDRLKKYNKSLKARVEMAHNTSTDLRKQISRLATQLKLHATARQQLQAEVRIAKTIIGQLENRCAQYESRIATMRQQMEVLVRRVSQSRSSFG